MSIDPLFVTNGLAFSSIITFNKIWSHTSKQFLKNISIGNSSIHRKSLSLPDDRDSFKKDKGKKGDRNDEKADSERSCVHFSSLTTPR